jgi:hypothetical protein
MQKEAKVKESLEVQLEALREMRCKRQLTIDEYAKQAILLSHAFISKGFVDDAVRILRGIPSSYFKSTHIEQMIEDKKFFKDCSSIADVLDELLDDEPVINMAGGDA